MTLFNVICLRPAIPQQVFFEAACIGMMPIRVNFDGEPRQERHCFDLHVTTSRVCNFAFGSPIG